MIDYGLLRTNILRWLDLQLPKTVVLSFPGSLGAGDYVVGLLNDRAIFGMGQGFRGSHNSTVAYIAQVLAGQLEVAAAVPGDLAGGAYTTITVTRRGGYDLALTGMEVQHSGLHTTDAITVTEGVIPAIWMNQNQPAPPEECYLGLQILDMATVGVDALKDPDAAGEAEVYGVRSFKLYLLGVGRGAYETLSGVADSLERLNVQEYLAGVNLAEVSRAAVRDISELQGAVIEERATLEVAFNMAVPYQTERVEEQVGVIETADWVGEVNP